ncbi:ABC transporter substrate-binding protein [Brucepastera parasyntrophica]|uniref:ABC transporter substrate-binding protein n=1 Tax=Brucepastera parasyntrophica TaxID=2880008 RepID=UPI00210D57AE|nr:ABC transporter substrate-binding protein [Brucepastera parasyntrophica]ULQ59773.1 ABC transporter substrate-binding protein [Brucepastera parasyntrophica]
MKKFFRIIICAMIALTLFGCSKKEGDSSTGAKVYKIGIVQLVEHVALNAAHEGFVAALAEEGYADGENIRIDYQNAQGELANCQTIAQKLVNARSDLILAIATPAAQAVANETKTIPILVTAVTDPESARLVASNSAPGGNVTGTSDLTPVAAQMQLLKQLVPDVKTVGLLYCSSEQNSKFQIDIAKEEANKLGINYIEATVSNSNEIQQVVQNLVGKVQAIYSPTDNMIASGMPAVVGITTPAKIPMICGEEGMVNQGGLATYGINYFELGRQTGKMAAEILSGEKKPAEMPIEYQQRYDITINMDTAQKLGITIPAELLAQVNE